jgi:hypothetical protein
MARGRVNSNSPEDTAAEPVADAAPVTAKGIL